MECPVCAAITELAGDELDRRLELLLHQLMTERGLSLVLAEEQERPDPPLTSLN